MSTTFNQHQSDKLAASSFENFAVTPHGLCEVKEHREKIC